MGSILSFLKGKGIKASQIEDFEVYYGDELPLNDDQKSIPKEELNGINAAAENFLENQTLDLSEDGLLC